MGEKVEGQNGEGLRAYNVLCGKVKILGWEKGKGLGVKGGREEGRVMGGQMGEKGRVKGTRWGKGYGWVKGGRVMGGEGWGKGRVKDLR